MLAVPAVAQETAVDTISPQDLYMPRNVQNALDNGTRSYDGRPGENYWQNPSTHNMSITLLLEEPLVMATEEIVYTNNSPDTLDSVKFRISLNIHKKERK